jgi:hypothetical protein
MRRIVLERLFIDSGRDGLVEKLFISVHILLTYEDSANRGAENESGVFACEWGV